MGQHLPHLLLAGMVVRHGERHQLFEGHAVIGIDFAQTRRDRCQFEALAHHGGRHAEVGGDVLDRAAFVDHGLHGAKLVEGMELLAHRIFRIAVLLGRYVGSGRLDDAGYESGACQPPLLHQQFERTVTPATGRNLEHAGFGTLLVQNGPDTEALQKSAPGDVFGKLGNGYPRLDPADVGLGQDQLVERDVARRAEGDFRRLFAHVVSP